MKHYYRVRTPSLPLGVNITTCLYVLWAFVPYLTKLRREILLVIVAMWVLTTFLSYPLGA